MLVPFAQAVVGTRFEDAVFGVWNRLTRHSWPRDAAEYDRLTISVMQRALRPDSNGIDVGAHRGTLLRHLVDIAPQGHHIAVEPLPVFAAGLRRRFPGVQVLELALAEEKGVTTFHHVVTNPSYSGLSRRRYPHSGEVVEDIAVHVERLDEVVPVELPIHFLKVDVEGGELGVMRGAHALIRRWRPVVVFEHGWSGDTEPSDGTTEALWTELTSSGLAVYDLTTWLSGGVPFTHAGFRESLARGTYYFVASSACAPSDQR
jgi:FkbM family methyltransferase